MDSDDLKGKDWDILTNGEILNYVIFADDPFGNPIAFDKQTNEIVWIGHEEAALSKAAKKVADSFSELNSMTVNSVSADVFSVDTRCLTWIILLFMHQLIGLIISLQQNNTHNRVIQRFSNNRTARTTPLIFRGAFLSVANRFPICYNE